MSTDYQILSKEFNFEKIQQKNWDASYAFSFLGCLEFVPKRNEVEQIVEFTVTKTGEYRIHNLRASHADGTHVCSALFKRKGNAKSVLVIFPYLKRGMCNKSDGYTSFKQYLDLFPEAFDVVIASYDDEIVREIITEIIVLRLFEIKSNDDCDNVFALKKRKTFFFNHLVLCILSYTLDKSYTDGLSL